MQNLNVLHRHTPCTREIHGLDPPSSRSVTTPLPDPGRPPRTVGVRLTLHSFLFSRPVPFFPKGPRSPRVLSFGLPSSRPPNPRVVSDLNPLPTCGVQGRSSNTDVKFRPGPNSESTTRVRFLCITKSVYFISLRIRNNRNFSLQKEREK